MLRSINALFTKLNTAVGLLSGGAMFLTGILLFIEVVCRYTGNPTAWISETCVYLFAGGLLLGSSYALSREKHVRVELVTGLLSPRLQDICFLLTSIGGAAFCLLVAYHGWVDLMDVIETGETTATTMRVPLWLTEMPVFVGFVLLAMQFSLHACARVVRLQQGSPLEGLHTGGGH